MTTFEVLEKSFGGIPKGLLVGGDTRGAGDGGTIPVIDPATEEVITEVADGTVEDALAAVDAASGAFGSWAATAPRQRAEILRTAFDLMQRHAEDLATLIVLENGKSITDARGEVAYAAEFFRWYGEEAVRSQGSISDAPSGTNKIMVLRRPIGVALLITPWNFPAAMATRKIGPALAAGCPVVLKPASETPLTALAIGRLLQDAGVPPGVVNVVTSRRSDAVASTLLDDDRVRKLSFTGSTEVGRVLLGHAARTVVSSSMELGGNAPFVVLEGADVDAAVSGAMVAKLRNGGSACTAANRLIVHASVADEFSRKLAAAMEKLVVGPGLDNETDIGPLVNAKTRDKVRDLVDGALAVGARALAGGGTPDRTGYYYVPTVLAGVPQDAAILGEEIFGPVAPVVTFDAADEAVAMANDTEYGLVSYVYGRDLAAALRVGEGIDSGMVGINRPVVSDPAAPFGGTKQSGLGREGGHEGMLEYTESKYMAVDWTA